MVFDEQGRERKVEIEVEAKTSAFTGHTPAWASAGREGKERLRLRLRLRLQPALRIRLYGFRRAEKRKKGSG
jgi:hypothetical protein